MGNELTEVDVIRRLFEPVANLPEPRTNQAIVVVVDGTERAVTHGQLENLMAHAIEQLKDHDVKEGDKVVFCCENSPELSSAILACWALNAMAVLIDYRAAHADVLEICKKLDAKLLLTSKPELFTHEGLIVLDVSTFANFKDTAQKSQFDIQSLDLDRPAFAILTSGTTGHPKVSIHNLRSLVRNIIDLVAASEMQSNMTSLTPLPISHIYGLSIFLVSQVLGLKTVLTQLEPVGFVKAVHRHKPELIAALPQFYGALFSAPDGYINLSNAKLLLCGGAPLASSLANKFEETFGKRLNNGYGSTECKLVAFNKDGPVLSVGKPINGVKVDIVNKQDEVMPEGKSGEVRIAGPMLMDGYFDNEKESKKVLRNGYYYSGDIGRFDNGNLFVIGRKEDVIIVDGVVVQAGEVEEVLRNFREVKDVAVTPVSNNHLGQMVKATVVLMSAKIADKLKSADPNERLKAQLLLQHQFSTFCRQRLTPYKRPMKWEFLGPHDDLPKTLAGKTDKKSL